MALLPAKTKGWGTQEDVKSVTIAGKNLIIYQEPRSMNCGSTIWDASLVLAKYLEHKSHLLSAKHLKQKDVLELGAGCGVVGLAYACTSARTVTITDLASVLPLLEKNLHANYLVKKAEEEERIIEVKEYSWGTDPKAAGLLDSYDVIVAADCIYDHCAIEPFVSSLRQLCTFRTYVIIANEKRDEEVQRHFLEVLQESFRVRKIPQQKMHPDYCPSLISLLKCRKRR